MGVRARGVGSRQHACIREGNHRHRAASDDDGEPVRVIQPWPGECRQALRNLAQHFHAVNIQPKNANRQCGQDNGDQDAGHALKTLKQQDRHQTGRPYREGIAVGFAIGHCPPQLPQLAQGAAAFDRNGEQFRQLADKHGERNAVHVAIAYGLGQQFGDEPQAQQAQNNADQPGDNGHQAGRGHRAHGVAPGHAQHHRKNGRGQRRIRPQHQDAAWPKNGIGQQRHNGGVKPVDARHTRRLGIGDAHRYQHRGQCQARRQVVGKPSRLI